MHQFTLSRPADISAAIAAHAQDAHVAFIAGGTDLIGLMKDRATFPERLLDLNRLPDMSYIEAPSGGGLRIGALARMSDVATHSSDLAVALTALDANVLVRSPGGQRSIPFAKFHRLPGDTPERDIVLDRGDLIISIEVPARTEGRASHYFKL